MATTTAQIPIYVQTAEMFIREIAAGRLIDGERLRPERDMAAELGIAVGTLRKALDDLASKGLLERVHGSGNYVRHNPDVASVYAFFRLELLEGGGLPTAKILEVEQLNKPDDIPQFGESTSGRRIRRIRYLSALPAAFEEIWLDGKWAENVRPADMSDSLYYYYKKSLGLVIARVEDRIGIASLPEWPDADIGCPAGTSVAFVERRSMVADGGVVEYSRTWFNPERVRYVARMK